MPYMPENTVYIGLNKSFKFLIDQPLFFYSLKKERVYTIHWDNEHKFYIWDKSKLHIL